MSYTALYRKFRPDTFDEVKGQDHIVTTLKNQINADRIGHAYLFCGTRGTGKTSVAKIFAKAVNCEAHVDGNPCKECEMCKKIASGTSMNVVEIDAASNNGVDNIRQIREEIQYSPTDGKYRVYIIDEVHMLSIGAFNALLKTLEEPPEYVIFILATTEVHKIPITILSRCQRYDFRRITIDVIAQRLSELAKRENLQIEDKAIRYIAKAADGSMRDALSLLDQCVAFYLGKELTYDNVLEVLGAVDMEVFSRLLRAVVEGDVSNCIQILEDMVMQGRELGQFVSDFIWYMRNLLLVKTSDNIEDVIDASKERLEALKEEAYILEIENLMRYINVFSELSNKIKFSAQKRVLIEIALIKLCRPAMENDLSAVYNRLSFLENQMERGAVYKQSDGDLENKTDKSQNVENNAKVYKTRYDKAVPEEVQKVVSEWGKIQKYLPARIRMALKDARFSVGGENTLLVVFDAGNIGYDLCVRSETVNLLNELIKEIIKKEVEVEVRCLEVSQNFEDSFQEILSRINMNVVEEDF